MALISYLHSSTSVFQFNSIEDNLIEGSISFNDSSQNLGELSSNHFLRMTLMHASNKWGVISRVSFGHPCS
jgi:hypothetical protein